MRVIAGSRRHLILKTVPGMAVRPTQDRTKETLFNILNPYLADCRFLDLFSGSGAIGIEALSRGAASAVFVDEREDACKLIRENLNRTRLQELARIVRSDYAQYLRRCRERFDIILLDPPYAEVFLENSLKLITEIDILQTNGIIVTERPVGKDLLFDYPGYTRSKDYKYSSTLLTIFRKEQ